MEEEGGEEEDVEVIEDGEEEGEEEGAGAITTITTGMITTITMIMSKMQIAIITTIIPQPKVELMFLQSLLNLQLNLLQLLL